MKRSPALPLLLAAAVLLPSCASTTVQTRYKANDRPARSLGQIAVIVVDERPEFRELAEKHFVHQLSQRGAQAFATAPILPLPAIQSDKNAAASRLKSLGAGAALVVRLTARQTVSQPRRPYLGVYDPARPETALYGFSDYDYLGAQSLTDVVAVESNLHDLDTGKLLWSAVAQTSLSEEADRVERLREVAARIAQRLAKDGLIP